jgi:uncharacterized membrane protein YjjP (DUF1212 family)
VRFVTAAVAAAAAATVIGLTVTVLLGRRLGHPSALWQLLTGLAVGLIAALFVLALSVDLVPDDLEPAMMRVGSAVLAASVVALLVYRMARR